MKIAESFSYPTLIVTTSNSDFLLAFCVIQLEKSSVFYTYHHAKPLLNTQSALICLLRYVNTV